MSKDNKAPEVSEAPKAPEVPHVKAHRIVEGKSLSFGSKGIKGAGEIVTAGDFVSDGEKCLADHIKRGTIKLS